MSTANNQKNTGAEDIVWDLSDLFSSVEDPKIQTILDETLKKADEFQRQFKGRVLALSPDVLKHALVTLESLLTPLYKVSQYCSLSLSTDISNDKIKELDSRCDDIQSQVSNKILFFDLELGKVDAEKMQGLINSPFLKNYSYYIKRCKETAGYHLSEKEEQLINLKDLSGVDAFQKLYEELTASFTFEFELDGVTKTYNGSQLRALRQHEDPSVRRRAMQTFFKKYEDHQLILTTIYNNVLRDFETEKKIRGYKSSISRRNVGNDLTDDSVAALHQVTTESYSLVQRYYKIKKQLLGLDELTLSDIYAPLPTHSKSYSYDEAKAIVLEGFKAFDDEFYGFAKAMFDENRIDAPPKQTKRGGAFCSSATPDIKPYVLLNFLGRQRDVSTMAHELGHAIHDMYACKQTLLNYHPILPLAETASVFSEMIITDLLRKRETERDARIALLTDKLEDIFATSHRQNMFSRFEMETHRRLDSSIMSTEQLCTLYKEELSLMFGDSVTISDEYKWEWAAIPHIFEWCFYVYAYNFGNLLVMALYQSYLEEGVSFIPKLKNVLSMGSVASPIEITREVGADITSADFWRKSLVYIESLIDELESLI